MSSRRPEQSASRRANRLHNASPYARPKAKPAAASTPQAEAGEVKASSSFTSLWNLISNPFKRKAEPPKSLPQIRQQQEQGDSSSEDEQESPQDRDYDDAEPGEDTQEVDEAIVVSNSVASSFASVDKPRYTAQIPFPLISPKKPEPSSSRLFSPAKTTTTPSRIPLFQSPATPGSSRGLYQKHPTSPGDLLALVHEKQEQAKHGINPSFSQDDLSALSEALEQRAGLNDSTSQPPVLGFLGSGLASTPSRSFLAPRSTSQSPNPAFQFTAGGSPASPVQNPRRRPVYVGPGQGSNMRPIRSSALAKSPSLNSALNKSRSSYGNARQSGTSTDLPTPEEEPTGGKRRRVEGTFGPQSSSNVFKVPEVPASSSSSSNGHPPLPHKAAEPRKPAETFIFGPPQNNFLRQATNPTPSPARPSPLRNVSKPVNNSPSPPHRSRTSNVLSAILKETDKDLGGTGTTAAKIGVEQAVINPFEKATPNIRSQIPKKKPVPMKKPVSPPKKPEPKKQELPSSAQAIFESLPTPKQSSGKAKASDAMDEDQPVPKPANGAKPPPFSFGKPSSKPSGSSPFLPPSKTSAPPKTNGTSSGPYTIDDVEDDDDIMEIQEVPPPKPSSSSRPKTNGFASSHPKKPSPPPIVIEELDDEDEEMSSNSHVKTSRPSLVIEAGEQKRLGRSPSLGPPGNIYSPSIPSPLRLVVMPEEDELAEDSSLNGTPAPAAEPMVIMENGDAMQEDEPTPEEKAKKAVVSSLPVYRFDFTVTSIPDVTSAKEAAKALTKDLPKYDLTSAPATTVSLSAAVAVTTPAAPAPIPFNWSAAGFKPKEQSGTWTCDTCGLSNPASATEKCTICDAKKAGAAPAPKAPPPPPAVPVTTTGFNFAAAGFKPTVAAGSWSCPTCMVTNTSDAERCISCTEKRP